MKQNSISTFHKMIASVLLISQLLTSCGFQENLAPSNPHLEPSSLVCEHSLDQDQSAQTSSHDTRLSAERNFQLHATTIADTRLTFTYTQGSGLQATYQQPTMLEAAPVQQYPVLYAVNGISKSFSDLSSEEATLLAIEGKWEVSAKGALRYLGMRGRGGMTGEGTTHKKTSDDEIQELKAKLKFVEDSIEKIKVEIKNKEDKLSILENVTHTSEEHKKEIIEEILELVEAKREQLSAKEERAEEIRKEIHDKQRQEHEKNAKDEEIRELKARLKEEEDKRKEAEEKQKELEKQLKEEENKRKKLEKLKKEEEKRRAEEEEKRKEAEKKALEFKKLQDALGNNYLGEKAWERLGITITDLPPISDDLRRCCANIIIIASPSF